MTVSEMKQRKQELGYSNEQISALSGVPLGTVMKVFSGATKSPRRSTLVALEKVLNPYYDVLRRQTDARPENRGSSENTLPSSVVREPIVPFGSVLRVVPDDDEPAGSPSGRLTDPDRPDPAMHPDRLYTIDDYYALPDDIRTELIDGVFYDMASPSISHQLIIGELHIQFKACEKKHAGKCRVLLSPCDVQLDRDQYTMVQPDLLVVCDREKIKERNCFGAPDLAVEILSPSSCSHDCVLKLRKYQNAGVREYWIVDPKHRQIIVYILDGEHGPTFKNYSFEDIIPIHISGGDCSVDFKEISDSLQF